MTDVPWTWFPGTDEPTENIGRKPGSIHPSDRRSTLRRDFIPTGTGSDDMDRLYRLQHGPFLILRMRRHRQRYSAITRGLMLSALLLVFGGFVVFLASAFLWESFSASIAAMTTLLGLFLFRLGISQMERDRKIAH